jgi:integrase
MLKKGSEFIMIEKNMLRDRADCLPPVTDEMYEAFNAENKSILTEFLDNSTHLSKQSVKQYTSALRIFFNYVKDYLKNKPVYEISKRDFLKYVTFLQNHGLSSSALKIKKSAVSSLVNYIETFVVEDDANYEKFKNFTKGLPLISANKVYEKVKITKEEYDFLIDTFINQEKYLYACWVAVSFNTGCRKEEARQFKSEIVNYPFPDDKSFIDSHKIRAKGKGEDGKVLSYMFNREAIKYVKLWLEKRGYEHEYIFTTKYNGEVSRVSEDWANDLCTRIISNLLNRRINPHIFRASAATYLMEKGTDITKISKYVLHHESLEVTQRYLIRDESEEKDSIF